jgi:hypothetical protein
MVLEDLVLRVVSHHFLKNNGIVIDVCIFFIIADVGGFFGNPEPEMLVRWYQVGIFSPFFRAHAHIDTKRREPFLFDQPYKGMVRDLMRLRYTLLPMWYTAFRETTVSGIPILRYERTLLLSSVTFHNLVL